MILFELILEILAIAIGVILVLNFVSMAFYIVYLTITLFVNTVRFIFKKPLFEIDDYVGF